MSVDFLQNLLIPNSSSRLIRLKDVASIRSRDGRISIKHYNGDRSVTITGDVNTGITTSQQVTRKLKQTFKDISYSYPGMHLVFGGESKESDETITDLMYAFLMAFILIYFIVVLLFRSVTQPFIIMSVIPFGLIGVLLAFTVHGIPLSFMGFIGFIGLSGVVINDCVIVVNTINKIMKNSDEASKEKIYQNIAKGARRRLRPVILTTLTTVAGLLPTIYGIGGDAKMMVPAVMAMAYGEIFATVLTLYFIPSLYLINMDINNKLKTIFNGINAKLAIVKNRLFGL
jgi:multidrug efflux pump subunit AcrB